MYLSKNFYLKNSLVVLAVFAGTAFSQTRAPIEEVGDSADKIRIRKVTAKGTGCFKKEDGKNNFKIRVNHRKNIIFAVFDDFIAKNSDDEPIRDCLLTFRVKFPKGKLAYFFKSKITGAAKVFRGDRPLVQTQLVLPKVTYDLEDFYVKPKSDGTWATPFKKYKGKQKAECGAETYDVTFHMFASIDGDNSNKSWIRIGRNIDQIGQESELHYTLEDCE